MNSHSPRNSDGTGLLVKADDGLSLRWGAAGVMRIVAGAEMTDGTFSVCEVTEPPGTAAPLHRHRAEAEAFYIIDGTVQLTCGRQTVTAGTGDFVYAPRGVPHKYAVIGDQPARMLLMFSRPGFESFFAEAGTPLDAPVVPATRALTEQLLDKYDLELLEAPSH
jgi:quercetin dioxygenase-like cupin family protein